jgi:DNA-directed RNA polymerase specialized sigma24 family protein
MDNADVVPTELLPYLTILLRQRPLVRKEWDTDDFYQELSHKYLAKVSAGLIRHVGKGQQMSLLRMMAFRMCSDKLRRIRRDIRYAHDNLRLKVNETSKPFIERFQRLKAFLKPVYQEVLELKLEGFTWDEIAEKMQPRKTSNGWFRGFQRNVRAFVLKERATHGD